MSIAQATLEAEQDAYARTSKLVVRVQSHMVLPSGCVVTCVTREADGLTTWMDAACGRATTDEFGEYGYPFIDEAVESWHVGDEITAPGDFERELSRATEAVVKAAATLVRVRTSTAFASRNDQAVAVLAADEHWRDMLKARRAVIARASRAGWSVRRIATAAHVDHSTVHKVTRKLAGRRA